MASRKTWRRRSSVRKLKLCKMTAVPALFCGLFLISCHVLNEKRSAQWKPLVRWYPYWHKHFLCLDVERKQKKEYIRGWTSNCGWRKEEVCLACTQIEFPLLSISGVFWEEDISLYYHCKGGYWMKLLMYVSLCLLIIDPCHWVLLHWRLKQLTCYGELHLGLNDGQNGDNKIFELCIWWTIYKEYEERSES